MTLRRTAWLTATAAVFFASIALAGRHYLRSASV